MPNFHIRNPAKHEYELQPGSSHQARMIYLSVQEGAAVRKAAQWLGQNPTETHVRLYHTHPSPGPLRRYVGTVTPDGLLHRAG